MRTADGCIRLEGNSPRATIYAACRFLQDQLGAVLFLNSYYWCTDLDKKFGDPTFKVNFKDDVSKPPS